jgi:hypothetical protein
MLLHSTSNEKTSSQTGFCLRVLPGLDHDTMTRADGGPMRSIDNGCDERGVLCVSATTRRNCHYTQTLGYSRSCET